MTSAGSTAQRWSRAATSCCSGSTTGPPTPPGSTTTSTCTTSTSSATTEATALTYHTSHQVKTDAPNVCTKIVARYHDKLRKEDGAWKIADKVMEIGWVETTEAEQAPR